MKKLREEIVKNTVYGTIRVIMNKIGGLIFTIILARLLLPELFGLYSIALSVIILILSFTDLGINSALIRYVSYYTGKNNKEKTRQYTKYFLKIKIFLIAITSILIIIFAKPLSIYFFNKPELFYLLLASLFYIITAPLEGFAESFFVIKKEVKYTIVLEFIFQVSRILLTIISIKLFIGLDKIIGVLIGLGLTSLIASIYTINYLLKNWSYLFEKDKYLNVDKKKVKKYITYLTISTLSLILFGSIDMLMLGRFVPTEYAGYYKVALSFVTSMAAITSLTYAILPFFTQLKKDKLEKLLKIIIKYSSILTIPVIFGLIILGNKLIVFVFGNNYGDSIHPGYWLSPLIFITALNSIFLNLFQAREKTKITAEVTIYSLILNLILNYTLIKLLLNYSDLHATIGAAIATTASQLFLLVLLCIQSKKVLNIELSKAIVISTIKPIFSSVVMSLFLIYINNFLSGGIINYIIRIILGAIIYFITLFIIKGLTITDLRNVNLIIKSKKF